MKKAFSLIELSIVILIIGILVAGVTTASRLVAQFRLQAAQTLTKSSPVSGIKDLTLWYETSLDSSFLEAERTDGANITNWYDNNPQSGYKNHATQSTATNQPLYIENAINGVPVVRFDGNDNFLTYDGSFEVGTNYTVFVVEQRRAVSADFQIFLGGSQTTANSNLVLGYRNNTTMTQAHWGNDLDVTVAGYTSPTPLMHTFWFSSAVGKKYWANGGVSADGSNNQTPQVLSFANARIGRYLTFYYNGDIAEIIFFTRDLKTEERQAVESYLSKKYRITIS